MQFLTDSLKESELFQKEMWRSIISEQKWRSSSIQFLNDSVNESKLFERSWRGEVVVHYFTRRRGGPAPYASFTDSLRESQPFEKEKWRSLQRTGSLTMRHKEESNTFR